VRRILAAPAVVLAHVFFRDPLQGVIENLQPLLDGALAHVLARDAIRRFSQGPPPSRIERADVNLQEQP
jgi:hypothetical protein